MQHKISILGIAPYEGMAKLLKDTAANRDDLKLTVRVGDLEEGLFIAKEMTGNQHFDVLVSRGGTAELLRQNLDIPLVEVSISVYDILRCIKMAENFSGSFAIAGFRSITAAAAILCDLLEIQAQIITFSDAAEVRPLLRELKQDDLSLVICDQITYNISREIGLNAILVSSGQESIAQALDNAVQLTRSLSMLIRQKELYKAALSGKQEAAMIFDSTGQLQYSNLSGRSSDSQIGSMIQNNLDEYRNSRKQHTVKRIGDINYQIYYHSMDYDGEPFSIFRIQKQPSLYEESDRTILIYNDSSETGSDVIFDSSSANLVGETHEMLERYAASSFPVLITGEIGTGKEKAAALIYQYSNLRNNPYYVIDCVLMDQWKWSQLLSGSNSPLNQSKVTIHFKNIEHLNQRETEMLFQYIRNTDLENRCRLIFSMVRTEKQTANMETALINQFSCLLLPLTPLRERSQDIIRIATLYFNHMNLFLGKQVVGFDPEAAKLICRYHWPHNLDQFRRVLKEAMLLTDSAYISEETVWKILRQEEKRLQPEQKSAGTICLNINRTLEQISQDVIHAVLAEEGMNKEKAAARLGISRTTLWRMLKSFEDTK